MPQIILIAHNIRSTYNVGSIFRTAEGFGVQKIYLTGYTPYPSLPGDTRPPHIRDKITKQIGKTALHAEQLVPFEHSEVPEPIIAGYQQQGFTIAALEQAPDSILLPRYHAPSKLVLLLGEEVHGITDTLLGQCDVALEIPMHGKKESFNVSVATAIALYALTMG
ncbi:MAG TPA: TrmH family RNA methyltransferase [Candidatus Acidoferrum sp.]|nr:TrmH family RNA methyltransferase [Candidatus Acidoferrum sp.]